MEAAFGALDRGKADEARDLAERLAAKRGISNEEWGVPDFILGSLSARQGEAAAGKERNEAFRQAALYLQRSRQRGFPAHRQATGLYLLGKSLCQCGRLDEALPVLEAALREPGDHALELRGLLIAALGGVHPPELDKALAESMKLLADPQLSDDARGTRSWSRRGSSSAWTARRRAPRCWTRRRGSDALRPGIAAPRQGRAQRRSGRQEGARHDRCLTPSLALQACPDARARRYNWQSTGSARPSARTPRRPRRRPACYLIGVCLAEQGDLTAAVAQIERTSRLYPQSPEFMAALFQQGEIFRRMGRQESVSAYQRLITAYSRIDEFHNPWIGPPQIQATLQGVCREYVKAEKYNTALAISNLLFRLMPKDEALSSGSKSIAPGARTSWTRPSIFRPNGPKSRARRPAAFRRAGDSYTDLARELFTTRDYPEQLWSPPPPIPPATIFAARPACADLPP